MEADGETADSVSFSGFKGEAKSKDELPLSSALSDLRCKDKEEGDSPRDAVGVLLLDECRRWADGLGVNWSLRSRVKSQNTLLVESGYCPKTKTSTRCSDGESEKVSPVGLDDDVIG